VRNYTTNPTISKLVSSNLLNKTTPTYFSIHLKLFPSYMQNMALFYSWNWGLEWKAQFHERWHV